MEETLLAFVSWLYIAGKSCRVRFSQPPVPSPWNQSGNVRFKRRIGSSRAETKVKWLSWEIIMRLEMVDVLYATADNISVTAMARVQRHPPVWELGEADDKYTIQNSWGPVISSLEVWKSNQRNAIEIQMDNRKSDTLIVPKKLLITVEGRGVHFIASIKWKAVCLNRACTVLCRDMGSNPHIY